MLLGIQKYMTGALLTQRNSSFTYSKLYAFLKLASEIKYTLFFDLVQATYNLFLVDGANSDNVLPL
jgi:hypothetical protein